MRKLDDTAHAIIALGAAIARREQPTIVIAEVEAIIGELEGKGEISAAAAAYLMEHASGFAMDDLQWRRIMHDEDE